MPIQRMSGPPTYDSAIPKPIASPTPQPRSQLPQLKDGGSSTPVRRTSRPSTYDSSPSDSSSPAIPSSPLVLISQNVEPIASPTPQPRSQIPQLKDGRPSTPVQPTSRPPTYDPSPSAIPSSPPVLISTQNAEPIAASTPQPRSQIPQLKRTPSQGPGRQPLGTRGLLRRHAVDGVYSSPDRQAPHVDIPLDQIPVLRPQATLVERINLLVSVLRTRDLNMCPIIPSL